MKPLTSDSLNLIHIEVDTSKLSDLKLVNLDIEIQTTFDKSNVISGLRLKWRFRGESRIKKQVVFNFLIEDTFDIYPIVVMTIEATRLLVYKSYSAVVNEFDAQMIKKGLPPARTPTILDESVVLRVAKSLQTPKR